MYRVMIPFLVTLVMLSAITCAGEPKPLTVQEYADTVCGLEEDIPGDITWGEYGDEVNRIIDTYEDITPPDSLKTYHQVRMAAVKSVSAIIDNKDADATVNPFEFITEPSLLGHGLAIQGAENDLDTASRQILVQRGCINES